MCLVDIVTFPACNHSEYLFASACSAGYSHEQNHCTARYHEIRALIPSAPGDLYCRTCYFNKLDWLRDGYTLSYLNVIKDARKLGWTKEDVRGSLLDVELEMSEAVAEWKTECEREEGLDDPKRYLHDKASLLTLFLPTHSDFAANQPIKSTRTQKPKVTKQHAMYAGARGPIRSVVGKK
ncbi:hypothetical protein N7G274_008067 [Stereocaulon virgatum]|uniref:Uncharacterized protein n=1 Tax=Stereocaulon virgatum TaxID=373712 RepID=A0ABR4A1V7_9LECA